MEKVSIVNTNLRNSFNEHRNKLSQTEMSLIEDYLSNLDESFHQSPQKPNSPESSSDIARAILSLCAIDGNKSRWHVGDHKPQLSAEARSKIDLALRKVEELLGEL